MQTPPVLTAEEIAANFTFDRQDPPANTFELGLVLGGTVSAGAYTAGFLDAFVEAMDEWQKARLADAATGQAPTVPSHNVALDIVSGTSGGGVNAATLARAIAFDFPHAASPATPPQGNPFWDLWVGNFDIMRLLQTDDLADPDPAFSVLDSNAIDDFADKIVTFGQGAAPLARGWVRNPFRIILTLTNLDGVPYLLPMVSTAPTLGEYFTDHADHSRFAIALDSTVPASPIPSRPYEIQLPAADTSGAVADQWAKFAEHAKGTAAFPLGFRIRNPSRPLDQYRWRITLQPGPDKTYTAYPLTPAWQQLTSRPDPDTPGWIVTPVVDGGAMDNEPIELARTWLAGLTGRNPRLPNQANRAVVLVDPLASSTFDPAATGKPLDILSTILGTMIAGARFETADLLLMADPDIFSRFMVTPSNAAGYVGERAIAGGGFGAFMGFLCKDFRAHDFMKGRADCHDFLANSLKMDPSNPVFDGMNSTQLNKLRAPDGKLRLVPFYGAAQTTPLPPTWPQGKLTDEALGDIETALSARIAAVLDKADIFGQQGWLASLAIKLAEQWGADAIASFAVTAIKADRDTWGLT